LKQRKKETAVNLNEELLENYYEEESSSSVPTGTELTEVTFENTSMIYLEKERRQDSIVEEIPEDLRDDIILYLNSKDEETWKPLMGLVSKPASLMVIKDREVRKVVQQCAEKKISLQEMIADIQWIIEKREKEEEEAEERAYQIWKDFAGDMRRYYFSKYDDDVKMYDAIEHIEHILRSWE
jgi:hypothetical protein